MRLSNVLTLIITSSAILGARSLALGRRTTLSHRLDSSTCEFYGYVDNEEVYNEYTIEMAGWGNDGSSNSCAFGIPGYIQTQCRTELDNFACTQIHENLHDTQISFRINKAAISQPSCVTQALKLASSAIHIEQTIDCFCLAECWPSKPARQE
ncbi:hypothetical protein NUW58_g4145 [Xylaria curta]|uniref:Uncharacterized protein n=1 Tax=Xylaria curta TaxID=42375 RepID=A0ACC1P8M3_9PEZI|nr:hypothetical protein NUW58_g4145 [Xylaria curta]